MKNKTLFITLVVLVAVLGVAAAVYPKLSAGMQTQQLATTPAAEADATPPETAVPEATTEPAKPKTVPAPDFTVLDWDGNEVKLSDYLGKPVVLNFWAHWCGPCQKEMPEFNAAYERLEGEVTFLMVHVGAAVEDGKAKVTEGEYTFPVAFDVDRYAASIYGVTGYPTTFFIDAEGNVHGYYKGIMNAGMLQQGIDFIYKG